MKKSFILSTLLILSAPSWAVDLPVQNDHFWNVSSDGSVKLSEDPYLRKNLQIETSENKKVFKHVGPNNKVEVSLLQQKDADGKIFTSEFDVRMKKVTWASFVESDASGVKALTTCDFLFESSEGCISVTPEMCEKLEQKISSINDEKINECKDVMKELDHITSDLESETFKALRKIPADHQQFIKSSAKVKETKLIDISKGGVESDVIFMPRDSHTKFSKFSHASEAKELCDKAKASFAKSVVPSSKAQNSSAVAK